MGAIGPHGVPMNLSREEERLIRALRIGDFKTAQSIFDEGKLRRIGQDTAIVRALNEGERS